jgi:protein TonB
MKYPPLRYALPAAAAMLAACNSTPPQQEAPQQAQQPAPQVAQPAVVAQQPEAAKATRSSGAADPRAYRKDAAGHIYGLNKERIYKGRMPPLLYAIGVLQVEVDNRGQVQKLNWMRAPNHAPEVVAEIERTVRAAAPFPAPARMGKVVYTDTWLWHKSGRFQLDTLTEGQD